MYDTVSLVLVKTCFPNAVGMSLIPVRKLRSHMPKGGGEKRRLALWPKTWLSFVNVACVFEKKIHFLIIGVRVFYIFSSSSGVSEGRVVGTGGTPDTACVSCESLSSLKHQITERCRKLWLIIRKCIFFQTHMQHLQKLSHGHKNKSRCPMTYGTDFLTGDQTHAHCIGRKQVLAIPKTVSCKKKQNNNKR